MPWAYIAREEVFHLATQVIDPRTKRPLTGSARVMYAVAYLCLPTSGPEAEKPENERVITESRVKFARDTGYSERTIQRGYQALERTGLLEFTADGRADASSVYTRQWQKFTLPLAPRGHWRVVVPRYVRKQRAREEADRERRKQRTLDRIERHTGESSRLAFATAQKITELVVAGTILSTETKSLPLPPPHGGEGEGGSASLRGTGGARGRSPAKPPGETNTKPAGALPRELPPDLAAARAKAWEASLKAKLARAERRALGLPAEPDDDPNPH